MRNIRVASVQFEHRNSDKEYNLARVKQLTAEAVDQGAELVIFPECCLSGYWFLRHLGREELNQLAEPVFDGKAHTRVLVAEARVVVELANDLAGDEGHVGSSES